MFIDTKPYNASLAHAAVSVAMARLEQKCESLNSDVVDLRDKYRMEVVQRRLLYNKVQELKGNIRVFCRCRKVWYGMVGFFSGALLVDFMYSLSNDALYLYSVCLRYK